MKNIVRIVAVLGVLILLPLFAPAAMSAGEPAHSCVTVVADLSGSITVAPHASAKPEQRWPVQLMKCVPAGKVLMLDSTARATLFFPTTGVAFELRGPGKFQITADRVQPLDGAAVPSHLPLNDAFRDIQLDRSHLAPGGVRMRDPSVRAAVTQIEPAGIVLSQALLVFRWEPTGNDKRYRVQLTRQRRELIYESVTDKTELTLPSDIHLTEGERFWWCVEEVPAERRTSACWQEFILATPSARALAERIEKELPSPNAAERNLRDLLLLQMMLTGKN